MTKDQIEEIVEEIMRCYHMHNYAEYSDEVLRTKYRELVEQGRIIERIEK